MSSTLNTAQVAALEAVANGNPADVHHRTAAALTKRGLVVERDGKLTLTDTGLEVFVANGGELADAEAAKPKRSKKARPCGCGCGEQTGGGLWKPGHDARWAGVVGRQVATDLGFVEDDAEVAEYIALRAPEGTSDALVAKAAKVARAAMSKAASRTQKQTA